MADDTSSEALKGARWQALTNGHYHSQRESFLGFVDRAITFVVLLAGAGVVVSALNNIAQTAAAVAITAFAMLQLVFAIGPTARRHATLCEKYFSIAADLEVDRLSPKEANAAMLRLAGEEGPIYAAAHAVSENWAKEAVYGDGVNGLCEMVWWRRLSRHFVRHSAHKFHS